MRENDGVQNIFTANSCELCMHVRTGLLLNLLFDLKIIPLM